MAVNGGRTAAAGTPAFVMADAPLIETHRLEVPGSLRPRGACRHRIQPLNSLKSRIQNAQLKDNEFLSRRYIAAGMHRAT
jgi:hypothetical protein